MPLGLIAQNILLITNNETVTISTAVFCKIISYNKLTQFKTLTL